MTIGTVCAALIHHQDAVVKFKVTNNNGTL